LAKRFGVSQYPAPAGGCLLTDKGYADRLRDLFAHKEPDTEADLELLKVGRHIRLENGAKLIAGRNRKENEAIEKHYDPARDTAVSVLRWPSPTILIPAGGTPKTVTTAAAICVGYSKAPKDAAVDVRVLFPEGTSIIQVKGISPAAIARLLV
jgi:tRNA-specific 2-thiouridylase